MNETRDEPVQPHRPYPPVCVLLAAVALVAAGCATYHARPLAPEAAAAHLRPPDMAALRVAVSELRHPLLPPIRFDLSDGLSPDEAALVAVANNPALRAVRAQRGVARANLIAAGLLPNPVLDAQADVPVGANASGEVTGYTLGLGFDLQALFTRGAERTAARAGAAQVDLDVAWQEWQVAQQARLQVLRLAFLRRAFDLAQQGEAAFGADVGVIRTADSLHLITAVDAAAAETALESARQTRLTAEAEQARARSALNQALGLPVDTTVVLQVDTARVPFLAVPPEQELLDSLQDRRLDLVALRRGYESQEATLRAAVLREFPAVTIGPVGTQDTGNFFTLGPLVSVGLPFFDRNQGSIAIGRATREQLYREYVARLFQARHEVDSLLVERRLTRDQLAGARRLLDVRRRLSASYRTARQAGNVDVVTYYQVLYDTYTAEMDVLRLEQTLAELDVALQVASGTYFPPVFSP